ncbi:ribosome assembly RNA-binding protein YhbY [Desulfobulbus alkaliphilus]|uniref:ribosome assembly RNA-binding protein YhbY n=1 Tax=Desulfobulbus alkaliphilus TaxID=869814 RepID=UPI00196373EA|nr:ribosome assembly RNA-binding protein YhbY [Desulfobulbus alkaliphilus]MBM9538012.1 ribosome assembly RNA-binding protein YhbY [Desulfobulbus alkaliphilus]
MTESTETEEVVLSSGQKRALRSMGHHLEPTVYVGREGLSPPLIKSADAALRAHELIKIKLGRNCPLERNEAAGELARTTGSLLVQVIGRMILLYRANPDLAAGKRITV